MLERVTKAVMLNSETYNEIEADSSLDNEAYMVVGGIALLNAIIAMLTNESIGVIGAVVIAAVTFGGYLLYSFLVYFIGTKLFGGTADAGELRRTLGYAYAPNALSSIPGLGFIASLWTLATGFVAAREALDIDNGKTFFTVLIAGVINFVVYGPIMGLITLAVAL